MRAWASEGEVEEAARQAAQLLVRAGLIMLVLSVLARFGGLSPASVVGDDLALLVSAVLVLTGWAYARFGKG